MPTSKNQQDAAQTASVHSISGFNGLTLQDLLRFDLVRQVSLGEGTELLFRIAVIGEPQCGKSSLVNCFSTNDDTQSDRLPPKIKMPDNTLVRLQIFDIQSEGKEENTWHTTKYLLLNSIGVIIVFDISNRESFEKAQVLLAKVKDTVHHPNSVLQLIGCKSDLLRDRQVKHSEAEELARRQNMAYFETSAFTGANIELSFLHLSEQLCRRLERSAIPFDGNCGAFRLLASQPTIDAYLAQMAASARNQPSCHFQPIHPATAVESSVAKDVFKPQAIFPPGRRQRRYTGWPEYAKGHEPKDERNRRNQQAEVSSTCLPFTSNESQANVTHDASNFSNCLQQHFALPAYLDDQVLRIKRTDDDPDDKKPKRIRPGVGKSAWTWISD